MISDLFKLREMFEQMHASGFRTESDLLWGYFFVDRGEGSLKRLWRLLEPQGYQFVEMHQPDAETVVMQVSRVETHTPESLHRRNLELNDLASSAGVALYDGWDVGPVENH